MNEQQLIDDNIKKHEFVGANYDGKHPEIYNKIEQDRLKNLLNWTVSLCNSRDGIQAFDFGCGTGNLTRHLLAAGCFVTVADVTPSFVKIASDIDQARTRGHILNGRDLHEITNDSFDLIATYSVLHHIPDYLAAVREMIRVIKPGGVIVIDHEGSDMYWQPNDALTQFRKETTTKQTFGSKLLRLLQPSWWVRRVRKTINPRYSVEGDIHVWPDDHIEWSKIRIVFQELNVDIVKDEDYLLYQPHYNVEHFEKFKSRCADMHVLVGKKR